MRFEHIKSALIASAIFGAGGFVFFMLHTPLPWMLGSLTVAAITAIAGGRWFMPAPARNVARPIVGVLAGSEFSASVVASIPEWWSAVLLVLVLSAAITLIGYVFFRKVRGFDRQTAFFAGAPGGLGGLTLLGGAMGGDVRTIHRPFDPHPRGAVLHTVHPAAHSRPSDRTDTADSAWRCAADGDRLGCAGLVRARRLRTCRGDQVSSWRGGCFRCC